MWRLEGARLRQLSGSSHRAAVIGLSRQDQNAEGMMLVKHMCWRCPGRVVRFEGLDDGHA